MSLTWDDIHPVRDLEKQVVDDIKVVATRMGVYVEWIGQRRAKGAGNSKGAPDCILYCSGHVVPIELKRPKGDGTPGGVLRKDQVTAIEKRAAQGVDTAVIDRYQDFVHLVNDCRKPKGRGAHHPGPS